ncbi:hypothetical protein B0H14DRAFT_352520 [Mycena olivaceomarginata]|nr:hypothetical protein B0H14DRAFT_352520 [Mycena olivaceomarginata]
MSPPDPIHTIEHNAVDELHAPSEKLSLSGCYIHQLSRCYSCRRKSMTAGARAARLHQPDRHPFSVHVLASSLRRQVGRVPGSRACGKHRPPARTTPSSLRRQSPPQARPRPIHTNIPNPRSASSILAFTSIAHEHISSPPLRNLASPSCMPPAPFASAYSTSPSTVHRPRVCSRRRGCAREVLGGLGLRLRAAASDRSRREALVAMVPILRHQPSSFALLLPANGARALHTSAFYFS